LAKTCFISLGTILSEMLSPRVHYLIEVFENNLADFPP